MHQQHELKKSEFQENNYLFQKIIALFHNILNFETSIFVRLSVGTKHLMNTISLDKHFIFSIFALTFPDFYLEVHIKESGCKKIRSIVQMSGYVAVKTDCE